MGHDYHFHSKPIDYDSDFHYRTPQHHRARLGKQRRQDYIVCLNLSGNPAYS